MALPSLQTRLSRVHSLVPHLQSDLQTFISSKSPFRIIRTIPHPTHPTRQSAPKTLYILDSSFNPPTRAHASLATSALLHPSPVDTTPRRLVLLFSTHNADKAGTNPTQFVDRLAMMMLFAEELLATISNKLVSQPDSAGVGLDAAGDSGVSLASAGIEGAVDIALTNQPLFADKSHVIDENEDAYPSQPRHVHLIGYDTFVRLLDPKYYNHDPPLSALAPYFEKGHSVRVTQRPAGGKENAEAEQEEYMQGLNNGSLEEQGLKREWADGMHMVPGNEGMGISSTRVREAVQEKDWATVNELCGEAVGSWIQEHGTYGE